MTTAFFVPGVPVPQGSKRHVGRGVLVESSKRLGPWRSTVTMAAREAHVGGVVDGYATVSCVFVFPRPKRHYRANGDLRDDAPTFHSSRPDVDKLVRAVLDGITGVVLRDDGQVGYVAATKMYGPVPGCEVIVRVPGAA